MKRRIIQQHQSYTVTLPIKWIRDNNLEKNDEVSFSQEDSKLILEPGESKKTIKTTEINLKTAKYSVYRSIIGGLYRDGYDEIKVNFENPKIITNLQKAVNSLYGLEVFEINNDSCTIKTVFKEEAAELNSHILKMIHILKTMQDIIYNDLKENKLNSTEELIQFRENILKQRDIIARTIVKQKLLDNQHFPYYNLAFNLWYISRYYSYLYKSFKKNINKKSLGLLKKTNDYFAEAFSEKTREKLAEKYDNFSDLMKQANKLLEDKNTAVASYCISILMMISNCNSLLLQLNY